MKNEDYFEGCVHTRFGKRKLSGGDQNINNQKNYNHWFVAISNGIYVLYQKPN